MVFAEITAGPSLRDRLVESLREVVSPYCEFAGTTETGVTVMFTERRAAQGGLLDYKQWLRQMLEAAGFKYKFTGHALREVLIDG